MVNSLKKLTQSQLAMPLFALFLVVIFNLFRDVGFFSISVITNNYGNTVLSGNIISILNGASELAILAIAMTLVTSVTKGQDISVGALAAIAGSIFVKVLRANEITMPVILMSLLAAVVVAILFALFTGTLVSKFNIQPMIASLILFTAGRPIAYWINGGATPNVESPLLNYIGSFIPGIPIPTPILIIIVFGILVTLALRFTNLGLYIQSVGINERAARLNGINPVFMKLLVFMILGVCVTIAGSINVCRIGLINHETILLDIEMDAILAVAIGGNALSGGKFKLAGSVIGAYIIQALTITLYAMQVSSTAVKAYKAIVIIALVVIGSPVIQEWALKLRDRLFKKPKKNNGEKLIWHY
ncbi:simple sugar transport system permease protein [Hydrogenispora ethanolica]|uniref:Simple sugar transport system permease protein n=1 Tax=Hydrogenispora ethanolica TaxID=1082276 RepID=A0A4R1QQD3_HYDET|nr:ABC transporter permease [Hydrogenispora ethanolica]TCL56026.1 simple sugar transport system permease protein [Hydrogenispora ethanolica]